VRTVDSLPCFTTSYRTLLVEEMSRELVESGFGRSRHFNLCDDEGTTREKKEGVPFFDGGL
jgi:hypothetical protein